MRLFFLTNKFAFVPGNKLDRLENIRGWSIAIALAALAAELLQIALNGQPTAVGFLPPGRLVDILYFIGAFAGVPAGVLLLANLATTRFKKVAIWTIAVGGALYGYQLVVNGGRGLTSPSSVVCLVVGPLGLAALLASFAGFRQPKDSQERLMATSFFKLAIILGLLTAATNSGLHSNRFLYPATWDYFVYRVDGAYGGFAVGVAQWFDRAPPVLQAAISTIYGVLIFGFYCVLALAIRKNEIARLNVWRTLVVPFGLAFLLYSFLPLSGPTYTFFSGQFPHNMPAPLSVAASQVVIPPAYRNGMPSMHLTGAILVWMLSVGLRSRPAMILSSILVMGTAIATLTLGEHYLLDLIVALPYAAFLGSALIWPHRLTARWKISFPIWAAALMFFSWLILLRASPNWLADTPTFVLALSALSIFSAAVVFVGVFSSAKTKVSTVEQLGATQTTCTVSVTPKWVIGAFFASGLAGLIYEVVYAKALAITFGSTALASYTVLATYMGGMAAGAWIGGYIADRVKTPLRTYAVCEAAIGIYAAATPLLFKIIQQIYVYFSFDVDPAAMWLTPFRLILGGICLGVPTILMGATLPLMFSHLRRLGVSSTKAIAPLYASNVVGAALGSLVAGYLLLPAVGRNGGTYLAAVISLMIALYVLDQQKRVSISTEVNRKIEGRVELPTAQLTPSSAKAGLAALAILFVGGAVTLGLEVNSMHMLAIVAGNSVYAFGLMLATFLAGLGLGSISGEYLMRRASRLTLLAWAQCGIAFAVALTAQLWDDLPSYFASFSLYPLPLSFSAREAIRALVCTAAMLPPAFFIGLSYPAAMSLATDWLSPRGGAKGLGLASALNTAGNISGVLLVGFFLLPEFGSRDTALVLSSIALILGIAAVLVNSPESKDQQRLASTFFLRSLPVIFAVAALAFFPKNWNYDDLSTGSNVYFSAQNWGKVIDHAESVEGGLTTVAKNDQGVTILLTNGKFQGNNSAGGEMLAQESFALFPLLHTAKRDAALVIGYGTGMTARVLRDLGFRAIDIAETSRDIVKMADSHFSNINSLISGAKGVAMHYTDGRNFLLTQSRRFDVISIEITSIWFAGAANLYNKDFYALAKTRLSEKGILQQWIQLHHISETDLIYAIGSVRSEFKYVWIYVRGGQGIIVASNNESALAYPGEALLYEANKNADRELQPAQLRSHLVLSPSGVDNLISHFDPTMRSLVSTDQNLFLEHSTPKGNALGNVVQKNIDMLSRFESGQHPADIR